MSLLGDNWLVISPFHGLYTHLVTVLKEFEFFSITFVNGFILMTACAHFDFQIYHWLPVMFLWIHQVLSKCHYYMKVLISVF